MGSATNKWQARVYADPTEVPVDWDEAVRTSDKACLFHSSTWGKASRRRLAYVGVQRQGRLAGGLVMQVDRNENSAYGMVSPFLGPWYSSGDVFGLEETVLERAVDEALVERLALDFSQWSFWCAPYKTDILPFLWAGCGYKLSYTRIIAAKDRRGIAGRISRRLRKNIALAARSGVSIRKDGGIEDVIRLSRLSLQHHNEEWPYDAEEIARIHRSLEGVGRSSCVMAILDDQYVVAGLWIVHGWRSDYVLLSGMDRSASPRGTLDLAYVHAIQRGGDSAQGCSWDFWGSSVPYIERHFRRYGGSLFPVLKVRGEAAK